jgi:hypothetical protein
MNRVNAFPVPVVTAGAALVLATLIAVPAAAQVTEIPALTIPNVVLDFDAMPAGPTTVAAIQGAFPTSALANLTFVTRDGTGGYDFQDGGGRALAPTDLAGTLSLIDTAAAFQNDDELIIDLSVPATEMGFEVGDWAGPFNVNAFDGAILIGSVQVSTVGDDREHFVQSTTPFDRIVLTANPDNPPANWVIPALHLAVVQQSVLEIPTLSQIGIALLLLLVAGAAVRALRRSAQV